MIPRVLRLLGFFVLVLVVLQALRWVPVIGPFFRNSFFGFWIAAILVSLALSRVATRTVDRRRSARKRAELGLVETPHNQGKLGTLLLAEGRARAAIGPLRIAVTGEPRSAEWRYRLGLALLATAKHDEAADELARAAELEPEHAYGGVQLRLAEALLKAGRREEALAVVERFEANHGPSPESAYRRGALLRALGRRDEARVSFATVGALAARSARFQRGEARAWAARALFARIF